MRLCLSARVFIGKSIAPAKNRINIRNGGEQIGQLNYCEARLAQRSSLDPPSTQRARDCFAVANETRWSRGCDTVKMLPRRKPGPTLRALSRRINGSRLSPGKRSG